MHKVMGVLIAASGLLAAGVQAQVAPPPPPPGGGLIRADANHDGVVTRAEMLADADARFTAMDANKDGKVTPEERDAAREAMRAQRRDGGALRGGGGGGMRGGPDGDTVVTRADSLQRAGARFDRLDTNHDGKLDAAELAAARPPRGPRRGGDMPPPPAPAAAAVPGQ